VLFGDDVVRLVWLEQVVFMNEAVFAATVGARSDIVPQGRRHSRDAHDFRCAARNFRASALRSVMR